MKALNLLIEKKLVKRLYLIIFCTYVIQYFNLFCYAVKRQIQNYVMYNAIIWSYSFI